MKTNMNMKKVMISVAVLAFGPAAALAQENRISYPSEENAILVIEQRGDSEIRAGSGYNYTLHVRNESDQPLHGVRVFQTLPSSFQIEEEEPRSVRRQGSQGPASMTESRENRSDRQEPQQLQETAEKGAAEGDDGNVPDSRAGSRREARERPADQQQGQPRGQQREMTQGRQGNREQQTTRVWEIGMLGPQETREIRVTAVPTREGELKSCVFASFDRSLCTTLKVTRPELRLTRQWVDDEGTEKDRFFVCDPVHIRYTVRNEGSGTTAETTITEELPQGLTTREGERKIEIDAGELEAGGSETFTVAVRAEKPGEYSNRATARAGDLSSQSNAESIRLHHAEIEVSVEGRGSQYIGRDVEYRITVQNQSDEVPALNTRVRIPGIDERIRFASTDQSIPAEVDVFNLGTLPPGEGRSFSIAFSSDAEGEISSKVEAMAYCAESVTTNISTEFRGIPALQVMVVDQMDPVPVDSETVYEITVLNEGTAMDADITLTGELPETLKFVSASGDSEVQAEGSQLKFDPVDNLAPGDRASWLVTVRGVQAGKGEFSVELKSKSGDARSGEPTTVY